MGDFQFLRIPGTGRWVILDPRRSLRPNVGNKAEAVCPFCLGHEKGEAEMYRVGGNPGDSNWHIRVIANKFPFAPIHEIVVHSPDHHKNFDELPISHVELILQTYRRRYQEHVKKGQVYIFHNRGIGAGESIPHPHSQIAVVPFEIKTDLQPLDLSIYSRRRDGSIINSENGKHRSKFKIISVDFLVSLFGLKSDVKENITEEVLETKHFMIYCPIASQWSDEVWIVPQRREMLFGDVSDGEIADMAFCLQRLINILDLRHGHEFAFNFYISPGKNWYLRIIPRHKVLGGFEASTGIVVNTQDPRETFAFIKEHFFEPDLYKIRVAHQADYWKSV